MAIKLIRSIQCVYMFHTSLFEYGYNKLIIKLYLSKQSVARVYIKITFNVNVFLRLAITVGDSVIFYFCHVQIIFYHKLFSTKIAETHAMCDGESLLV